MNEVIMRIHLQKTRPLETLINSGSPKEEAIAHDDEKEFEVKFPNEMSLDHHFFHWGKTLFHF